MTDTDLGAVVAEAYARTLASGSARLAYELRVHFEPGLGARFATKLVRTLTGQNGTGWIDFAARRHLTFAMDTAWRAPRADDRHEPKAAEDPASRVGSTWWLLDVLAAVVGAVEVGTDDVRGRPCRHLVAYADLAAASALSPYGLAAPAVDRYENLLALPVDVWLHDGRLARVLHTATTTCLIDLWDYGTDLAGVDWSAGLAL
jgi:hypothetical protein